MSRYRLFALVLVLATIAGLVALTLGWSSAAPFLAWIAHGFGIGVWGLVGTSLRLAAAFVVLASRLFGARGSRRSS